VARDEHRDQNGNVIDLAGARKRQQTTWRPRQGAASKNDAQASAAKGSSISVWAWIQFFIVLGLMTWLMNTCTGG
jgi:hypothetical protein